MKANEFFVLAVVSLAIALGNAIGRGLEWRSRRAHARRMRHQLDAAHERVIQMVKLFGVPELPVLTMDFKLPEPRWPDVAITYRTSPVRVPRLDPAPRTGLRSVAYLGNTLALRARPASAWRILGAWLRGAMVRLWWAGRTEWIGIIHTGHDGGVTGRSRSRDRKLGIGTVRRGPS